MEDLDSLLEDLGRGKSTATAKKSRPPSSRVDLNELEDLMEDLAAPTAKQTPAPTPISMPSKQSVAAPEQVPATKDTSVDDLEALMQSLNSSSRNSRRQSSKPSGISNGPTHPPVRKEPPTSQPTFSPPVSSPPATEKPMKNDDLDKLLNNLTQQMNNIDSDNPLSRGICFACKGPILGEIIQALGNTYHPEHFVCGNCRDPLGTRNFYEVNHIIYCDRCFMDVHCPKCAHCNEPVIDRCISALGKKWHVEHFICTQCLKPFPGGSFYERDGRPYCEADFYALFAPKCASCNEPIRGDCINALGSQWHPEHFACTYCGKSFAGGTFFEYNGKPYCETHYHQQSGSLCAGCGKPITGRCVNALEKKWHPEHFVCAFCMNPLAGGSFTEHNHKAYCKDCHGKLFGGQ